MKMDPGIDTGPMLAHAAIPIDPDDTAETLSLKLAELGAKLLLKTLPAYLRGELSPQLQDDSQSTYAPMLTKDDGALDFSQSAESLARKVRAYNPWPGAFMNWDGSVLKIHRAHSVSGSAQSGETVRVGKLPAVGTGSGLLVLDEVQPPGKKVMVGQVFLNGARGWGN
jgi:methionyl-tRNA formyltransferase